MTVQKQRPVSREEFARSLSDSGLSAADEIRRSFDALAGDGQAVSAALVEKGMLTAFQAEALLEGRPNDLAVGNYEILDRLGQGGMGTVFKARHRRMKRVVALKVLAREAGMNEAFVQRFQREVETIARLAHPNIVMAYDADEAEVGLYLVMEFVNGRDLGGEVAKNGPLSVADAVECIIQSARGLEYAHDQNIIHRDIKPGNLLRDVSGMVKVADLGLARLNEGGSAGINTSLTTAGSILGTMDYMPPEQAMDSASIDRRADIYSLGCTLYFLLAGKPPFSANSMMGLLLKHRDAPVPEIRDVRPDVPADVDAVYRKMVAKVPGDRFATMAEVARALEATRAKGPLPTTRPASGGPNTEVNDPAGATMTFGSSEQIAAVDAAKSMLVPKPEGPLAGWSIVLVEPSRTQAGIVKRFLAGSAATHVHAVGSGKEAIELAKRTNASAMVSAMHLSDMSGVVLAQLLRADAECDSVGFVLMSSGSEGDGVEALPSHPRVLLLPKPFTPAQLEAALQHVG